LGFKDPTLWPFLARERKSGSSRQGFESLLPGKKHPKLPEISLTLATFGQIIFLEEFLVLFGAFIRSVYFVTTVADLFCGIWGFGSERSESDSNSFFIIGLKIRKSRSPKTGIRNNTTLWTDA
jgi:hypothetical protein